MWRLTKKTVTGWFRADVFEHAAALSYITLFSIAPTLLITVGLVAMVLGHKTAQSRVFQEIQDWIGPMGAQTLQRMIQNAALNKRDLVATLVGGFFFLLGATAIFSQLKKVLNEIWSARPDPKRHSVLEFLRIRLISLVMVIVFGLFVLTTVLSSALLVSFGKLISAYLLIPLWVLRGINFVVSTSIIGLFFAMVFKFLPDIKIKWREVLPGALLTSFFFAAGKYLIALYISQSHILNIYGASGSLVVILVWVYYSSLIVFLGASFTQVYATDYRERFGAPSSSQPIFSRNSS